MSLYFSRIDPFQFTSSPQKKKASKKQIEKKDKPPIKNKRASKKEMDGIRVSFDLYQLIDII